MVFTKKEQKEIFTRAHLCSSVLISWLQREKRLIEKGKEDHYQKVRDLLRGNHPDSIDHYFVKNFGPGSMYNMEGRMKATDKNFRELLELIEKIEKFIKEDLEKGTEFEGEFEEKFPEVVKLEEERWDYYKIKEKGVKKKENIA
ncbi:MAG: hypothetical protein MRERV_42c022 [Mycoplasmataceae bacterium RV_VA103A]|nr:MAG: hypothetical protein MRERV_42c022 [Mycoplasmataceae bacterium RV_VA103A]